MEKKNNLDVEEVADLLQIPSAKVQRWVSQGQIPCRFKKEQCYFKRKEILDWAKSHDLTVFGQEEMDEPPEKTVFSLKAGIERGGVHFNLGGENPLSVIEYAVKEISFPLGIHERDVLEALIEREKIASTGIGRGVAIPHPRQPLPVKSPIIPVFFPRQSIDFHSVDGKSVWVLFFLFSPSTQLHLKLLSKLSFLLREESFLKNLKTCHTPKNVIALVEKFELMLEKSKAS